jgi:hypothetical protein
MFHYNSKPTWLPRNRRTQVADGEQEGSLGQVDRGRAMRMTAKLQSIFVPQSRQTVTSDRRFCSGRDGPGYPRKTATEQYG